MIKWNIPVHIGNKEIFLAKQEIKKFLLYVLLFSQKFTKFNSAFIFLLIFLNRNLLSLVRCLGNKEGYPSDLQSKTFKHSMQVKQEFHKCLGF